MTSRCGFPWGGPLIAACLAVALVAAAPPARSAATGAPGSSKAAPSIPLKLPADYVYRHGVGRDSSVVFSHQSHLALAGGQCVTCHPKPFLMLRPSPVPHHGEMNAGGSCGMCHDGKKAFGVQDAAGCQTCHSGIRLQSPVTAAGSAAPSARPLPKPHRFPPSADSPGPVTFRHEIHARDGGCVSCHPKPYRMAATPPLPGGGMHEKGSCGGCHDGKRTFATDDPDACTRCHQESGAHP